MNNHGTERISDVDLASSDSQPPADLPPPPDMAKWDDAADQFRIDLLAKVQASASAWSGAITALLGLFGTVTVITGTSDIAKIAEPTQGIVIGLTVIAGALAACSLYFATRAQQLPSVRSDNWRGSVYRAYVVSSAESAGLRLKKARALGMLAAGVIFMIGLTVMIYGAVHT
jgi:hypothetical protein